MSVDYWCKQEPGKSLFPDILWSKPEQRSLAGKLAIVGGNSHGFAGIAAAYKMALATGVGAVRVVLPDVLKKTLPVKFTDRITDTIFAPSNPSGGFSREAINELSAAAEWADTILFIGDTGQNSETAALLENFVNQNRETSIVITRDAVDLVKNIGENLLNRAPTHLVVSLNQLQKIFQSVYYPRVITFSQGVKQIAETLHKFTITYPVTITLFHNENLFVARDGQIITQPFNQPLRMWSGEIAVRESVWQIWNPTKIIESIATSWTEL